MPGKFQETQGILHRSYRVIGWCARWMDPTSKLMKQRKIETLVDPEIIRDGCLLCSEDAPTHCHRRLVAEYLRDAWKDIDIIHLK